MTEREVMAELVRFVGVLTYGKERWFKQNGCWYDRMFGDCIQNEVLLERITEAINDEIEDRPTEMMEDGTLAVRVSGAKDVSRVLVMDTDSHVGGGLYYVDKDNKPTGKWVFDEDGYFRCEVCGKKPNDQSATTDYCPHCGAKMGGAE